MRRHARTVGLGLVLTVVVSLVTATPAAAVDHPFETAQVNGSIDVGGLELPVPGDPEAACPGDGVTLGGQAKAGNVLAAATDAGIPFAVPFGGTKYLGMIGAGTAGTWVDAPPFEFQVDLTVLFTIKSYDPETCTAGAEECNGIISLSIEGVEILDVLPVGIPPFSAADRLTVWGSGEIDTVDRPGNTAATSCPGLLGLLVHEGASISISGDFEQVVPPI